MNKQTNKVVETQGRLPVGALDDLFIEYYLETASPANAYTRACNAYGKDVGEYAPQNGRVMYKRLQSRISEEIDKAETEDASLARMALRAIIERGDASDSSVIAAAKELQRKRADKLEISKPEPTGTELLAQIHQIDREIKETE